METNPSNGSKKKKQYEKPQVKQVVLKPEEAVLGACKTNSIAGPAQPYCQYSSLRCSTIGS